MSDSMFLYGVKVTGVRVECTGTTSRAGTERVCGAHRIITNPTLPTWSMQPHERFCFVCGSGCFRVITERAEPEVNDAA